MTVGVTVGVTVETMEETQNTLAAGLGEGVVEVVVAIPIYKAVASVLIRFTFRTLELEIDYPLESLPFFISYINVSTNARNWNE